MATSPGETSRLTADQRNEVRHRVEQPAMLRIPTIRGAIYLITILDVSRSGLRVGSPVTIPERTQVEVTLGKLKLTGAIRYAREIDASQFHLGIQVAAADESTLLRHLNLRLGI